jgi:hypothetical protein
MLREDARETTEHQNDGECECGDIECSRQGKGFAREDCAST